eukprot:133615_1
MGAELPHCCEMSCVPQVNETNDTGTIFNKEAQEKFSCADTAEPQIVTSNKPNLSIKTTSLNAVSSHSKKKRRHKHKKKKRSHHHYDHHAQKLKYKQSKRAQSCQVWRNDEPTDEDEEEDRIFCTQYNLLNAQNQLFIGKHASYFAETYSNDQDTIYSNDSFDSPLSIQSNSPSSIPSLHASASHAGSMSPLCELSDNHANIILAFNDISSPRSKPQLRPRSHSMPVPPPGPPSSRSAARACECVDDCIAIQRVLDALRWYSRYGNNSELLMQNIANIYEHLIDDYQHILNTHLTQELEINMGMEYALIKAKMDREIPLCDMRKCKGHRRYRQLKLKKGFVGECNEPFMTFMDSMHCFFMHSGDL